MQNAHHRGNNTGYRFALSVSNDLAEAGFTMLTVIGSHCNYDEDEDVHTAQVECVVDWRCVDSS